MNVLREITFLAAGPASERGVRPQMKRDIMHLATEGNRRVHDKPTPPVRIRVQTVPRAAARRPGLIFESVREALGFVIGFLFCSALVGFGIWKVTDQIEFGTGALTTEAEVDSSKPSSSTLGALVGERTALVHSPDLNQAVVVRGRGRWSPPAKGDRVGVLYDPRYAAPPEFKGRTKGPLVFRTEDGKLRSIDLSAMDSYHLAQGPTEGVELDSFWARYLIPLVALLLGGVPLLAWIGPRMATVCRACWGAMGRKNIREK